MKKFFKDFKKFIARGNILDMAVGVIIGGAFSKIVTSLVNDILMPLIASLGGGSVADLKWVIHKATLDADGAVVKAEAAVYYGNFLQSMIDFLLIALCLFIIIRIIMNITAKMHRDPDGYTVQEYADLRKQGKKRKEIKELEEAKIEKARADRANAPKPETTDDILKDIRNLLSEKKETK